MAGVAIADCSPQACKSLRLARSLDGEGGVAAFSKGVAETQSFEIDPVLQNLKYTKIVDLFFL